MNTPPDKQQPLNCDRDPARWASEFNGAVKQYGIDNIDEGFLIAWFANAMMCGEDTYRWRQEAASRSHGAATDTDSQFPPIQFVEWLQRWWKRDETWRNQQRAMFGMDVAQLLRGVADMIEQPCEAPRSATLPSLEHAKYVTTDLAAAEVQIAFERKSQAAEFYDAVVEVLAQKSATPDGSDHAV